MFGLTENDVHVINKSLSSYEEITAALIFGLRAKGSHKSGSDIDIALIGTGGQPVALPVSTLLNQESSSKDPRIFFCKQQGWIEKTFGQSRAYDNS